MNEAALKPRWDCTSREPAEFAMTRDERLLAMGKMAATLAHEIRNPLGSIELNCTLLKRDLVDNPKAQSLVINICDSVHQLNRVVTNCLQFTRNVRANFKAIDNIEGFLNDIKKSLEWKLESDGAELKVKHSGESRVVSDRYLLTQALSNLIVNAIEACEEGTRSKEVNLISEKRGTHWNLAVSDNGKGIAAADLEKVFDPCFSTKHTGTGLGLSIVHSIINSLGGVVRIQSAPNMGTTVTLTLEED